MEWVIDKSFDFCYGHRVHNQQLDAQLTSGGDTCLACRHLHGHQGKIKVFLTAPRLVNGMVTDFKHLGWFKDFIDEHLDHKMILDISDPLLPHEVPEYWNTEDEILDLGKCTFHDEVFWTPNLEHLSTDNSAIIEKYEGMVFVDFVPTSENLTAWLLAVVKERLEPHPVIVDAVEFWETPKSHCRVTVYGH